MAILQKAYPSLPILIVDDERESLLAFSATLRTVGMTNLLTISDAAIVPTLLSREEFSLMLLDLNMSGLSGYEILEKTAWLDRRPPVIVVTGSRPPAGLVIRASSNIIGVLTKPVDRHRLIDAVRAALDEPRLGRRVGDA